jgi:hypothetical protein
MQIRKNQKETWVQHKKLNRRRIKYQVISVIGKINSPTRTNFWGGLITAGLL